MPLVRASKDTICPTPGATLSHSEIYPNATFNRLIYNPGGTNQNTSDALEQIASEEILQIPLVRGGKISKKFKNLTNKCASHSAVKKSIPIESIIVAGINVCTLINKQLGNHLMALLYFCMAFDAESSYVSCD
jgi:hypothetical protein